jgi:hypothetical protein
MNTADGSSPDLRTDPGPDARLLGAAQDRGTLSDETIMACVERLIALRDLRDAKRRHKATAGILARLRDATRRAMA